MPGLGESFVRLMQEVEGVDRFALDNFELELNRVGSVVSTVGSWLLGGSIDPAVLQSFGPPVPAFYAHKYVTDQVIPTSDSEAITWEAEPRQANRFIKWSSTSNSERLNWHSMSHKQVFLVAGSVQWESNSTGERYVYLNKQPSNTSVNMSRINANSTSATVQSFAVPLWVFPNQQDTYFTINVWQTSGGDLKIEDCWLCVVRII